jgi:RNA-binding protein
MTPSSTADSRPSRAQIRQWRAIGHRLKPVLTIGDKGLSETVVGEAERALRDHELIKVRIAVGDRTARDALLAGLCERTGAQLVQRVGNIGLLLKRARTPDPKLSNLLRPLD